MNFIPNTNRDRELMLRAIGVNSIKELFKDIPDEIHLEKNLNINPPMSELELREHVTELSNKNKLFKSSFLGAGAYSHFIPSTVKHIISRSEFYTAYTPYQPEISQGMLQSIYEYQTLICSLTGQDVANASLYDGSTALAEAMIMSFFANNKREFIVSRTIHPEYRTVLKTYADAHEFTLKEIELNNGLTDLDKLSHAITENTSAVMIQNPNFFGCIEKLGEIEKIAKEKNILFVVCVVEPTSLGILNPPKNADIVVGEGQSFGNPLNFGGPYLGFMATKKEFMRKIPGRLVGATTDDRGNKGYVLTLQAREQHIRRENASSNICTNEGLCMLAALVHLVTLGKSGVKKVGELSMQKAHYLFNQIKELDNFAPVFNVPFYNEFVVKCRDIDNLIMELDNNNIQSGLDLGKFYPELKDHMLFCVAETTPKEELDRLIGVMEDL